MYRGTGFFVLLGVSACVRPPSRPVLVMPAATRASYARYGADRPDARQLGSAAVVFPFHPDDTLAFARSEREGPRLARPLTATPLSLREEQQLDSLTQAAEQAHGLPSGRYRHQYLPVMDGRGHKVVWGNGLCDVLLAGGADGWTRHVISAAGGGACFYNMLLDLTTLRYGAFTTNASR